MSFKNSIDMKTLGTVFLGIWTMVIVCIVVGKFLFFFFFKHFFLVSKELSKKDFWHSLGMYATWEAKMLGNNAGGRGELGTTEPLGMIFSGHFD